MLDLTRREKEQLSIRTDINLPKEILESMDEFGHRFGEDQRVLIDFSLGEN